MRSVKVSTRDYVAMQDERKRCWLRLQPQTALEVAMMRQLWACLDIATPHPASMPKQPALPLENPKPIHFLFDDSSRVAGSTT